MIQKEEIANSYRDIQDEITSSLELLDGGASFQEEVWSREGGGGGRTRILQNGNLIEKGGVNFSAVYGELPETIRKAFKTEETSFFATGVSIVLHPSNPFVPIIHMNIRYFQTGESIRWFGGGIDLTPHYVIPEDARYFHEHLKTVCDKYDPFFYPKFKERADNYFYIKHRKETRGVGGIFYDRLNTENTGLDWKDIFAFSCDLGRSFAPIYSAIANKNRNVAFGNEEKEWQYLRRSRYVEFNLVYDDGTKFGLETNGRVESILMSLPPQANWAYNYQPLEGSKEFNTQSFLKKDIDWLKVL